MKRLLLLFLSAGMLWSAAAQDTLDEVRKVGDEEFEKIQAGYRSDLSKLRDQLLIALGKARETAKKSGDLDAVKTFDAELERWKSEGDLPLVEPEQPEITKLYGLYKDASADRLLKKHRAIIVWFRGYDARLATLEKSLVAADKIKDAEEVRSERDTHRDSMTLGEAQDAVKAAEASDPASKPTAAARAKAWFNLKGVKWKKADGSQHFKEFLDKFDRPLSFKGKPLSARDFIFTHASGRLEYEFEKPITGFRGAACLATGAPNLDQSDILFSIETDEGVVFRSKLITGANPREDIEISFKPSKKLVLVVNDNGNRESDWSLWLNPQYR